MYRIILAALDLEHGEHTQTILGALKELADAQGAEVRLLTVIPAGPAIVSQYLQENYEGLASSEAAKRLQELGAAIATDKVKVTSEVRFGTVYDEILAAAEKAGADLIVVGSNQPSTAGFLLGTNAARVVRHATCSVFVVR